MKKITAAEFNEMKETAIDVFHYPKGNFWIVHSKTNNLFYAVRHKASQYWVSKSTKSFTTVMRAIINIENLTWQNPASQSIFY